MTLKEYVWETWRRMVGASRHFAAIVWKASSCGSWEPWVLNGVSFGIGLWIKVMKLGI